MQAQIDLVMVHEQLGGRIAPEYSKTGLKSVWDPTKVFYILDHWVPPPDIRAANMHRQAEQFARDYKFKHVCDRNAGICHQVLPEEGFAYPGQLIVGSDSHTTTYGAFNCFSTGIGATDVSLVFATGELWFRVPETRLITFMGSFSTGVSAKDLCLQMLSDYTTDGAIYDAFEFQCETPSSLSIDARMTISNMVQEMGAKCGIFSCDSVLRRWLEANENVPPFSPIESDPTSPVIETRHYELNQLVPLVAKPHSPDNVVPVSEVGEVEIDQAFLGSCTNGRLEDLRAAAQIVRGKRVHGRVKFIVIPASRQVYLDAMREGLLEIFIKAGATVGYPSCGPCIGGHTGVLGDDEICVSSSNRNFKGRMGAASSKIYLASPETVAATAITGKITNQEDL